MSQECGLYFTPADPEFTTTDSDPPHFISLSTAPPLPAIEIDTSASLDLDLPIAH